MPGETSIHFFCTARGVAVPPAFYRRPPKRWAAIRTDCTPFKLVALTFATEGDVQMFLRREIEFSLLADGSDLPYVVLDGETSSLHAVTWDCCVGNWLEAIPSHRLPFHEPQSRPDTDIQFIGIHKFPAPEPCHLIEALVTGGDGVLDWGVFTQELPGVHESSWQVAYAANILSPDGTTVLAGEYAASLRPELWRRPIRVTFFFHYLSFQRPILTPFGAVALLAPTALPERLACVSYTPPD